MVGRCSSNLDGTPCEEKTERPNGSVTDDDSIPNRGLSATSFGARNEKIGREKEISPEVPIKTEGTICPKQLFDSKDWPGIHLNEIELNPEGVFSDSKTGHKPPFSYAVLIKKALSESTEGHLSLSEIYKWIKDSFPYYRTADPAWQNSIRHNLSLNRMFVKVKRPLTDPGKGGFWKLNPEFQAPKSRGKKEKENL